MKKVDIEVADGINMHIRIPIGDQYTESLVGSSID